MSDLIRRKAVLDYPIRLDHYDEEHGNRHFVLGIESVMEYVEYLPSADAVEVIRCKDCKWSESNHSNQDGYFCHHDRHNSIWQEFSHDFCSHGERREP